MPDHIRFILRHAAFGAVIAAAFVALLLVFNIGNLWHLVSHTAEGPIALLILFVLCTITFGSAQVGYKIMTLDQDDDDTGGRRDPIPQDPALIPIRVRDRR